MSSYAPIWERSRTDPEGFWLDAAREIAWSDPPTRALKHDEATAWSWFPDGRLNISANALDRHVDAGRGEAVALQYHSAMTGTAKAYTYRELRDRVAAFAGALRDLGVRVGDRVLIYLPMTPEAVIAMLACARLGAIHSVVFGGFAATELATRIEDARPRVIVTSSGGLEPGRAVEYLPIVRKALEAAPGIVESVVVSDRAAVPGNALEMRDTVADVVWHDWAELIATATAADPVAVDAEHPLYVLYTSGTTGRPKGIVRDTGGYAVALAWSMRHIYDIGAGDTMFTASDVGWVVGHSFIVYGPLLAGATTVLYEGKPVGTPDAGEFWRIVEAYGVKTMFTAPTALRAIRRVDPDLEHLRGVDLSSLQSLFLAGERLDPDTWHWARDGVGVPVIDHWWQTETGWPVCAIPRGLDPLEPRAGSTAVPMPGFAVSVLDRKGQEITEPGSEGSIALRLPLPPGALLGIWGDDSRFREAYLDAYPGYYATGDAGYIDADGYVFVMGRTDDVINVAGHRLSTGAFEEILAAHPAVAECAVVGARDELKGQRAVGFVALKANHPIDAATLTRELVALVREHIGPVAAFRDVVVLQRLPKTRSGKILRKTIRQIIDGDEYTVPPTIEDPTVLDELVAGCADV